MIQYKSTRGDDKLYAFSETILKGIAQDGGLFIPERLPRFTLGQLELLSKKSYQKRAEFVINLFEPDFPENIIEKLVKQAYSTNFDNPYIAPLVHIKGNQYILELWHGPTFAFKDMALQIVSLLFSEAAKMKNKRLIQEGEKPLRYLILVATSGDTGKAALEGYKDKANLSIAVFYPDKHVSQLQELQMVTQDGSNVAVYAVQGDFDTVQTLVKDIFSDNEFNENLLYNYRTVLSSANSINWGRLLPQIVYHMSAYVDLVEKHVISIGKQIDVAVPTGNFGNILAAFYAKKMGLPIHRLICASNANNVLTEFLQTGVYDIARRALVQTPSPSMDILIASNVERLLYAITQNPQKVSAWINELKIKGKFVVDESTKKVLRQEFYADWVSNEDCLSNIRGLYDETEYLVDPHTSVAQMVAERYIKQASIVLPIVVCSTAHWAKFPRDVYYALTKNVSDEEEFKLLAKISGSVPNTQVPRDISELRNKKVRHDNKSGADKESVERLIIDFVK